MSGPPNVAKHLGFQMHHLPKKSLKKSPEETPCRKKISLCSKETWFDQKKGLSASTAICKLQSTWYCTSWRESTEVSIHGGHSTLRWAVKRKSQIGSKVTDQKWRAETTGEPELLPQRKSSQGSLVVSKLKLGETQFSNSSDPQPLWDTLTPDEQRQTNRFIDLFFWFSQFLFGKYFTIYSLANPPWMWTWVVVSNTFLIFTSTWQNDPVWLFD